MNDDRAQSSSVGAILLVGVVVLTVGTFGTFFLGTVSDGSEQLNAVVDSDVYLAEGPAPNGTLELTHASGRPLGESGLRVRPRVNGTEWTNVTWSDGTPVGDGDGEFEPGETWRTEGLPFEEGTRVRLILVDEPSGTVLVDRQTTVSDREVTPVPSSVMEGPDSWFDSPPVTTSVRPSTLRPRTARTRT